MRKLLLFTVGFAASIFLYVCLLRKMDFLSIVLAFASFLLILLTFLSSRKPAVRIRLMLVGVISGFICANLWSSFYYEPLESIDGETLALQIEVTSYCEPSLYGYETEGILRIDSIPYRAIVYLKDEMDLHPGDILSGAFRIRMTAPNGLGESSYLQAEGIALKASPKGSVSHIHTEKTKWYYFPQVISQKSKELMQSIFPEDVLPIVKAVTLGDTNDLDYETDTAFKVSGIRHIMAVSGLHVMFLYQLLYTFTKSRKYFSFFVCSAGLILFAGIAGFTPSVCRAVILVIVMMLADLVQKEYDSLSALSFAVLLMAGFNPFVVKYVGFQLSVCSVAGILVFSDSLRNWFNEQLGCSKGKGRKQRFFRAVSSSISLSLSAMFFTVPIMLYYFGTFSVIGVITNLCTIWLVGIVFVGIMVSCMVGFIFPVAGRILSVVIAIPIRYVVGCAKIFSRLPYACLYIQNRFILLFVVFIYLALAYYYVFRTKGRKLVILAVLAFAVSNLLGAIDPRIDTFRISVLDVGQGQSIILQSKGKTFVVDCGGSSDAKAADMTAQTLLSQGIFRVDGLIVTHYDSDHSGGVCNFLSRVQADMVYLPKLEYDYRDDAFAKSINVPIYWINEPVKLPVGLAELQIISTKEVKTDNENSLAVLFAGGNCDILITGDRNRSGEKALIKTGLLHPVDILVAGHHGSKNATSDELLDVTSPQIIVVSVSKGNSYGHPSEEMLERARAHGSVVRRTDESGTIIYRRWQRGQKE